MFRGESALAGKDQPSPIGSQSRTIFSSRSIHQGTNVDGCGPFSVLVVADPNVAASMAARGSPTPQQQVAFVGCNEGFDGKSTWNVDLAAKILRWRLVAVNNSGNIHFRVDASDSWDPRELEIGVAGHGNEVDVVLVRLVDGRGQQGWFTPPAASASA